MKYFQAKSKLVCNDIILKTMFPEKNTSQSDKIEYAKNISTLNLYRTLINTNILDDVAENYTLDSESDVKFWFPITVLSQGSLKMVTGLKSYLSKNSSKIIVGLLKGQTMKQ